MVAQNEAGLRTKLGYRYFASRLLSRGQPHRQGNVPHRILATFNFQVH